MPVHMYYENHKPLQFHSYPFYTCSLFNRLKLFINILNEQVGIKCYPAILQCSPFITLCLESIYTGLDNKNFQRKIVNIF